MKIETIAVAELSLDPSNVRKHSRRNLDAIKASLRKFGQQKPIVVDTKGIVLAGNGTLTAAKELGWTEIQATRTELAGVEATMFAIADNRTAELAEWEDSLAEVLKSLANAEIDLTELGFNQNELAKISSDLVGDPEIDAEAQPDKSEELRVKWGVELGQIWQLGDHRIACGDSTAPEVIAKVFGKEKADLIFTDPPYNHASDDGGFAASVSPAHRKLMESEWDKNFDIKPSLSVMGSALADSSTIYVCTSWHLAGDIWKWMAENCDHHSYCVWEKPNPMPSLAKRHWTWATELICYGTRGRHIFNFPIEGHAPNVWRVNKKSDGSHPTQKPVELIEHAINHSSSAGQIVADFFLGSGTTIIACERTARKCYGIELNPGYVAVSIQRWADATGRTPIKL